MMDKEIYADIATLKAEVTFFKLRLTEMEEECKERDSMLEKQFTVLEARQEKRLATLERWRMTYDKAAAKWGVVLTVVASFFTGIATYWDQIKDFFKAAR